METIELHKEENIMNVAKIIRILGYIVYTILWSPVIVLCIIGMPIVAAGLCIRSGGTGKEGIAAYKDLLIKSVQHDINFIRTGEW